MFDFIPAYELIQVLYQPEKAQEVYAKMNEEERDAVYLLTNVLESKKEDISRSKSCKPRSAVAFCFATKNVQNYFKYLGYSIECFRDRELEKHITIIEW